MCDIIKIEHLPPHPALGWTVYVMPVRFTHFSNSYLKTNKTCKNHRKKVRSLIISMVPFLLIYTIQALISILKYRSISFYKGFHCVLNLILMHCIYIIHASTVYFQGKTISLTYNFNLFTLLLSSKIYLSKTFF